MNISLPDSRDPIVNNHTRIVPVRGHPDDIVAASDWLKRNPPQSPYRTLATVEAYFHSPAYNDVVWKTLALSEDRRNPPSPTAAKVHREIFPKVHEVADKIKNYRVTGNPIPVTQTAKHRMWTSLVPQLEFRILELLFTAPLSTFAVNDAKTMHSFLDQNVVEIDGVQYRLDLPEPATLRTFWLEEPNPTTLFSNWGRKLIEAGRQIPPECINHKFDGALSRDQGPFGKGIRTFDGYGGFSVDPRLHQCTTLAGAKAVEELASALLIAVRSVLSGGNPQIGFLWSLIYVETGVIIAIAHRNMLSHLITKLLEDSQATADITTPKALSKYLEGWQVPAGPGKEVGTQVKRMRRSFEKIMAIWKQSDQSLPELSEAFLPVIQANPMSVWLDSNGPYELPRYYAKSIGKDDMWLQEVTEDEIVRRVHALSKEIWQSGCQRPGCWLGPHSPYRPEFGLQNPFATETQLYCISHFREALLLKEVLGFDPSQYQLFLTHDKSFIANGGTIFHFAGRFSLCEGPFCDGQSYPMEGVTTKQLSLKDCALEFYPNAYQPYLSLCRGCQTRHQTSYLRQHVAMQAAAKDAGCDIHQLPPAKRVMRCEGEENVDLMSQCPGWGITPGCWHWAGALTNGCARPMFDVNGHKLCRPCSGKVPGLVTRENLSSLGPEFTAALRSSILDIIFRNDPGLQFLQELYDNVYKVYAGYAVPVSIQLWFMRTRIADKTVKKISAMRELHKILKARAAPAQDMSLIKIEHDETDDKMDDTDSSDSVPAGIVRGGMQAGPSS